VSTGEGDAFEATDSAVITGDESQIGDNVELDLDIDVDLNSGAPTLAPDYVEPKPEYELAVEEPYEAPPVEAAVMPEAEVMVEAAEEPMDDMPTD
ncbi:MAG: hypothetical protein ACC652_06280, partial [Acidimicrobiales bacterium]